MKDLYRSESVPSDYIMCYFTFMVVHNEYPKVELSIQCN